ncbi:MAG: hypothetical protein HND52_09440 [Ignavibacteriae bacterium]|nr:hypothetical protein [Ignavibacteriota bacterium]NOG98174.1 hypothetical protein [Ignavibacteriota bacterium]
MTTLPPSKVNEFPEDSLEKKVYNIADSLEEYIPIMNDRNRLGYNLYKFMTGEGDSPEVIVRNAKLTVENISYDELANKIKQELEKIK